jgi:polysaccharide export outer membrane protein
MATGLATLAWLAMPASAQAPNKADPADKPALRATYDAYLIGPGDALEVELQDIPEYSGVFSIGPDGTMYLPRLRGLYVEGLTVEELRYFLTQQFKAYVRNPQVYVRPVAYRPIRVYVGGEIRRPGYYYLSGEQTLDDSSLGMRPLAAAGMPMQQSQAALSGQSAGSTVNPQIRAVAIRQPTVFDAIRAGQGVTPFSDLASVNVTRKQPLSAGGGKIRTTLNFLSLITEGDESQNIRLFDGDMVVVGRSPVVLREQILKAAETNLSPDIIEVFVSGRVKDASVISGQGQGRGTIRLPQGSSLNQAIAAAGGPKLLRGQVEFLRFNRDGSTDRRLFGFDAGASAGSQKNPILMSGDVIRVNDSALSASVEVLNELTGPFVGIYSVYSLFR